MSHCGELIAAAARESVAAAARGMLRASSPWSRSSPVEEEVRVSLASWPSRESRKRERRVKTPQREDLAGRDRTEEEEERSQEDQQRPWFSRVSRFGVMRE